MRRLGVPFVLFALAAGAACGSDQDPSLDVPATTAAPDATGGATGGATTSTAAAADFEITLRGDAEVPGPGDADGTGRARLTLVPERSEICYAIEVADIGTASAAHIHQAPAGESGPVVLDISPPPPTTGEWDGCAAANQVLLEQLSASPSDFYVNVHNTEFPNGAVRGQLS